MEILTNEKGYLTHWSRTVERVLPSVGIVMILVGDTEGLWKLPMQHYAKMKTKIAEHRCLLDKETHRSPTQLHDDLQKRSVNHNSTIDLQVSHVLACVAGVWKGREREFCHVLSNVLQCSKCYVRCDWSVSITPNSTRQNSRFCTSIDCTSQVTPVLNRPFYWYGGHIELIRFKEYYRMPMGHEHISFVFSSALRDIFS